MNKSLISKRQILILVYICCAVYFISYITRVSYATIISEIIISANYSKSQVALVTTACFITYGVGQLLSGYLGDKFSAKWIIFIGLIATSIFNCSMPFCSNIKYMTIIWAFNGLAQAMMWPPLVKLLTNYLNGEWFEKACVKVSSSSSMATVFLYLISPIIIVSYGWRYVFYFTSVLGFIMAFIWIVVLKWFEKNVGIGSKSECTNNIENSIHKEETLKKIFTFSLVLIMLAIILQGILRDGVTTWMPTYIVDNFKLSASVSIFSSVIIPIFSIVSFYTTSYIHRKFIKNEVKCAFLLFIIGAIMAGSMTLTFGVSPWVSLIFAALITGCMHGINLMLVCTVPLRFTSTNKTSTISGVLNACTYVGSAISSYGIAILAEKLGWRITVLGWMIICIVGGFLCIIAYSTLRRLKV